MIDAIFAFGQGLMGGIWPGTVWPVVWTLIKIVCVLFRLSRSMAMSPGWPSKLPYPMTTHSGPTIATGSAVEVVRRSAWRKETHVLPVRDPAG